MRSLEDRYGERVEAWGDRLDEWLDRPHPRLVRNVKRTVIAFDLFVATPMVAWAVVHAVRVQSHPITYTEKYWFAYGLLAEFLVGAGLLYGLAHRAIWHGWRLTTYGRAEMLAVLLLMVACPVAVFMVYPSDSTGASAGLAAVPVTALWLTMARSLVRRAWRKSP